MQHTKWQGRTSSGPSACPPPAGRASQMSSCSVRQILPAACRGAACGPLRHAANPLSIVIRDRAGPSLCRRRRRSAWRAERTTGPLVVRDCPVSSVPCAICRYMSSLMQDPVVAYHVFPSRFWRSRRVPLPGCAPSLPVRADWRGRTG